MAVSAGAESALREALALDDGQRRMEIIKNLAMCYLNKKRYKESADAYEKARVVVFWEGKGALQGQETKPDLIPVIKKLSFYG